jgi:hypothetical protein
MIGISVVGGMAPSKDFKDKMVMQERKSLTILLVSSNPEPMKTPCDEKNT